MPDLNPDGTVNLDPDPPTNAHLHPDAIVACTLCDSDGYRGTVVCIHRPPTRGGKGRAAVDDALAEIRHRKVAAAKQPYRHNERADSRGPAATEGDERPSGDHPDVDGGVR